MAADSKISALSAASALTGAELVPVVQSGSTVRSTAQYVANLATSAPYTFGGSYGTGTIGAQLNTLGAGSVSSVALSLPSVFTVSGSPVTSTGTLTAVLTGQSANTILAGPTTGSLATPTFRALVPADYPAFVASGASHARGAVPDPGATAGASRFLREDGAWTILASTPYRANITGAVSIDLVATANSSNLHLTLTGNVTSFALTNPADGAQYKFKFIQDATGSRTFAAFPSAFKFAGGTAPVFSTAANAVDYMTAEYGSTSGTYMCVFYKGMA